MSLRRRGTVAHVESAFVGVPAFAQRGLAVALDVTEEAQAAAAVVLALSRFGEINYLVNNAGRGLVGAIEEVSASEADGVFATKVFGTLNVIRAVLPHMRSQRAGHGVNISSMGGFAQVPGWGWYGATKFAIEGLSEAMAAELAPLGVLVTVVEPGSFPTDFLDGRSLNAATREIADYATTSGRGATGSGSQQPHADE